jgi:PhzF family phenazine biosynthesis protein
MKINIYQVDAFTDKVFGGNPAAICPLNEWLPDEILQQIAMENNLSETAFLVKNGKEYDIRWFTPSTEVDLCGHATLASAEVIFHEWSFREDELVFHSRSGALRVRKEVNGKLTLDFPVDNPQLVEDAPPSILAGLKMEHASIYKGTSDYMVVAENQSQVEALMPDFRTLAQAQCRGVVVTAPGDECDFVSRCFFPQSGIDEDPVTGSAHTLMTPYWAERLGKLQLSAIQVSKRRGYLDCQLAGDRVLMSGHAAMYMKGEIEI